MAGTGATLDPDGWLKEYLDSSFAGMRGEIQGLRKDLRGLTKDLDNTRYRLTLLEGERSGGRRAGAVFREWLGWFAAIALVVVGWHPWQ